MPACDDLTISEVDRDLAAAVEVGLLQFAQTFLSAQDDRETRAQDLDALVPTDLAPQEAIACAFGLAREQGWLADLCARCMADRIVLRRFATIAAEANATPGSIAMQAWVNDQSPFYDTLLQAQGLIHVADFVCRILVDGEHRGTGFLVRPDVVLTAGHVLSAPDGGDPLVGAGGAAEPDAADRIEVLFSDRIELISGRRRRIPPRRFAVADDWLLAHEVPDGTATGQTDYALIRLEAAPNLQPDALALVNEAPFPGDSMLIIQHPRANPVCHSFGSIDRPDPGIGIFTHTTNTEPGSSGAPCFSPDFRVVGIHSGEVRGANPPRNAALSSAVVAPVLDRLPQIPAPARYVTEFRLRGGGDRMVVGREETQDWMRAALSGGGGRILAVSAPEPGVRRCGMTFTADLLQALLPAGEHRIVRLSADQFSNDEPTGFARRLCGGAGAPASLTLSTGPGPDSTPESWLRREFTDEVLGHLDVLRGDRMLWLVLDDLMRATLAERNGLREFLDLIYEAAADRPWLRIILLGYDTAPPPGAAPILERMTLPPINADMIREEFEIRLGSLQDKNAAERIRANLAGLWSLLPSLSSDDQLDFAADIAATAVKDLT